MSSSIDAETGWLHSQLRHGPAVDLAPSTAVLALALLVLVPVVASSLIGGSKIPKLPVANPSGNLFLAFRRRMAFVKEGMDVLKDARKRFAGVPYIMKTHGGDVMVLPPDQANEIRNHPGLSFRGRVVDEFPTALPGFEPYAMIDRPDGLIASIAKKHLTKRLNAVTEPLAKETTFAINTALGNPEEWKEVKIYDPLVDIIARLSSRVFLGPELCRDEEWIDVAKNFTIHSNAGGQNMRKIPKFLWPVLALFDPACRKTRQTRSRGRALVRTVLDKRQRERAEAAAQGMPAPVYNDAFEWAQKEAVGAYDATDIQLLLSFVAIHTTSDLTVQTLIQLANTPGSIEPLREEMIEVLRTEGWKKTSLYKLKLLDSAIKEAQRMKPLQQVGMMRRAMTDVTLPNGLSLKKGAYTAVDSYRMWDPELHEEPERFDIHRWRRMRETPGAEHKAQLVSTTADNLAFGLGTYACPGRFFASNEIKISLCHLLLKYDWRVAEGSSIEPVYFGTDPLVDPETRLEYRRRREEIDLDALEVDASE